MKRSKVVNLPRYRKSRTRPWTTTRFLGCVEMLPEAPGCWLWNRALMNEGYGQVLMENHRKKILAHRLSWELFQGSIPDGLCVLHRCDVRCCVNPGHLFVGTKADNNADMCRKGRHWRSGSATKNLRGGP